ncbi:MAG: hypothetical protein LBC73_05905 [Oscillospiraceae bacterium]|jgi:membrane-bound serine protease (ClpP class)|nr:hypothetical protein [Oscillospiraceae bacterium]
MALIELLSSVSWVSVVLFLVGLGFVIAEMLQPGFGFCGILGILSFVGCIFVTSNTVTEGIILTAFFSVILLIMLGIFFILISKGKIPNKLILRDSESKDLGYSGTVDFEKYVGKSGVTKVACRPVGIVDFDGTEIEVVSNGEFIEKDVSVDVIEIEGNRVVVKPQK